MWGGVAAALRGFVLPWALLDLRVEQLPDKVTRAAGRVTAGTPLEGVAGELTQGVDRVVATVTRGARTVTGQLPTLTDIPKQVSGLEIPRLAHRQDAQVALALAELLTGERDLGKKIYVVYLVPGLALLLALLVTLAGRLRVVCGIAAVLALAIAGMGCWKLATVNPSTLLVAITIGTGLWMSLWAYAGIGLGALLLAVVGGGKSRR